MQEESDYFYRRNASVEERLLRGDKPSKIAHDYGMSIKTVESMFPECNYRVFCTTVKRRYGMGETSYEIAKILGVSHTLILSVLDMSFSREAMVYAIMRMHDNGFSIPNIRKITKLRDNDIRNVLEVTGRNVEKMRYYKSIGTKFSSTIDTENWYMEVLKEITEHERPNYLIEIENKIEAKYRNKADKIYQGIAKEELEYGDGVTEDDNQFADKIIEKLRKMYGIPKRKFITKAVLHFAKRVGIVNDGGALGGKDVTRLRNEMESEIDELYLSIAEIKQTKMHKIQERFANRRNKKK